MASRKSRLLVVDASVARASGGPEATAPTSVCCREFLRTMLEACHRLALRPSLNEEWRTHRSRFARTWLVSMYARKKVGWVDAASNDALRRKTAQTAHTSKAQQALLKDMHLIETALAADRIVIALDEEVRKLLREAARTVGELSGLLWVNPAIEAEEAVRWLREKAKHEPHRLLGFDKESE